MESGNIFKLSLLENAYDYLNSSLEYVVRAKRTSSQKAWKFAIINLAHCIELMLKERLRREHELLIYANLDKYRPITRETQTVSWTVLIERIKLVLGDDFGRIDAGRLNLAQRLRNQMLHYDVEIEFPTIYQEFANLLNFVVEFHRKELRESEEETLHQKVDRELWLEEEALSQAFYEEIAYFNNIFMRKSLQEAIIEEQGRPFLIIQGNEYARIKYGSPDEWADVDTNYAGVPCHDCLVIKGQIHLLDCDMECCPKCKKQLISCGCGYQYPPGIDTE
jgi:hypothetical protein